MLYKFTWHHCYKYESVSKCYINLPGIPVINMWHNHQRETVPVCLPPCKFIPFLLIDALKHFRKWLRFCDFVWLRCVIDTEESVWFFKKLKNLTHKKTFKTLQLYKKCFSPWTWGTDGIYCIYENAVPNNSWNWLLNRRKNPFWKVQKYFDSWYKLHCGVFFAHANISEKSKQYNNLIIIIN